MNVFIWRKNNVSFSRYQDFVLLWNLHISKSVMSYNASQTHAYFFWILSPIKMKFGQILVCWMTNISNMFLAECWRLGTSTKLFYDFIKMKIQQDMAIFNGWHIPFLIVLYSPFQKRETLESCHVWLLSNWGGLLNWKNLSPVSQIIQKITENYCTCLYLSTGQVWWLHDLCFKRYTQKCTLPHVLILIVTSLIW